MDKPSKLKALNDEDFLKVVPCLTVTFKHITRDMSLANVNRSSIKLEHCQLCSGAIFRPYGFQCPPATVFFVKENIVTLDWMEKYIDVEYGAGVVPLGEYAITDNIYLSYEAIAAEAIYDAYQPIDRLNDFINDIKWREMSPAQRREDMRRAVRLIRLFIDYGHPLDAMEPIIRRSIEIGIPGTQEILDDLTK